MELGAITGLMEDARCQRGRTLLVKGPAGIGKTSLLDQAQITAGQKGLLVLRAAGSELETEEPFGVVRQLLRPVMVTLGAGGLEGRSPCEASALELLGLLAPGGRRSPQGPAERRALLIQGLYELSESLSRERPLAMLIDDLQWADRSSLRWVTYLARRAEDMNLALVVAMRTTGNTGPSSANPDSGFLLAAPSVAHLGLEPFSEGAVRRLLKDRIGSDPTENFARECVRLTGGNPFLVQALVGHVAEESIKPDDQAAGRLRQLRPPAVEQSLMYRFGRLPETAQQLARAVSVLGDGASLAEAAALARLSEDDAAEAAAVLLQAGLFRDELSLRFEHPIIAAGVHDEMPWVTRSAWHARAARVLRVRGRPSERVAAHLLASDTTCEPPDIATLQEAAQHAADRGDPASAARYLRRARTEMAGDAKPKLLELLANALSAVVDPEAEAAFDEAHAAAETVTDRARISLAKSRFELLVGRPLVANQVVEAGISELAAWQPPDPGSQAGAHRLRTGMEVWRAGLAVLDRQLAPNFERLVPQLSHLAEGGDPSARPVRILLGFRLAYTGGDPGQSFALIDGGLAGGAMVADDPENLVVLSWAARGLIALDRLESACTLAHEMLQAADRFGLVATRAMGLNWLASISRRRGRLAAAEQHARAAHLLAEEHDLDFVRMFSGGFLAESLYEQGRFREALALLDRMPANPMDGTSAGTIALRARAANVLALGRTSEAIRLVRQCGEVLDGCEFRNPNLAPWRSLLAAALPAEERQEARCLAAKELQLARAAGSIRAEAVALRTQGLLAKRPAERVADLTESVRLLSDIEAEFELARSLHALGATLRRCGRPAEARPALARATDLADRCGSAWLRDRARDELRASGGRPRRLRLTGFDALTSREQTVCLLAAEGLTNRELAEHLYITEKTVAAHLTRAYAKLGISSRRELTAVLGSQNEPSAVQSSLVASEVRPHQSTSGV